MASQSGPAGERLLAVGERALVRAFARVDTTMARKRAAVTEWLCNMSDALQEQS